MMTIRNIFILSSFFFYPKRPDRLWPTQPSVRCDVDRSPPTSTDVKNECRNTLFPLYVIMDRNNFIFSIFGVVKVNVEVKVKQSHYRPGQSLRVPGR